MFFWGVASTFSGFSIPKNGQKTGGHPPVSDQKKCFFWWLKVAKNIPGGGVFYTGLGRFWGEKAIFWGDDEDRKTG